MRDTERKPGRVEKREVFVAKKTLPHVKSVKLSDRCETEGMCVSEVTEDEPGTERLLGSI